MASISSSVVTEKRYHSATPVLKDTHTQDISKTEPGRQLRSSSARQAQKHQKDTVYPFPHSSQKENRPSAPKPPKPRKRLRLAEVEQATDYRRTERPRQLDQQTSPAEQPKGKKRRRETLDPLHKNPIDSPQKRARQSPQKFVVEASVNKEEVTSQVSEEGINPIRYWTKTYQWPNAYAKPSGHSMDHLLARQKSSNSLRRKRSEPASFAPPSITPSSTAPSWTTPSDQKPREAKSIPYQDARYEVLLATRGSFMRPSELGITEQSRKTYRKLLDTTQAIPSDSLFRDDLFEWTCQNLQNRNEARVIQDITRLIVPSAETLTIFGAKHLSILIESINEGWNNSMPLENTRPQTNSSMGFKRPQPDYSVGFRRDAFTSAQLDKLAPFIGDFISGDHSFAMATFYSYFPFLTCEVKCGAAALEIADRQNAYSMTLAVRAVANLFQIVGREMELNREILAFSISHDHRSVRIHGCYPIIDGKDIKYYRHPIRTFDFTELDGREKWAAYKFTKNVYDIWVPTHFERLCSAIDEIPDDLDFTVPLLSESFGLSQDLERHRLLESSQPESQLREASQQSTGNAKDSTPDTSFTGPGAPKRPRKRQTAAE